ncbi:hypothetical protein [Candidatus Uabimicrobium amorphum]|uniref:C2 domain-containing protein n=1 Tax=Uabimicrobium amorphum TaxID=2596890 RepID=A0A5S9IMH6_UABAM|nr:hypothetical protein [Candidatus Uabimicrobium amorphum]BBM84623.1 hypothetical protein UABAM_02984 [Candidatus Uabimicrobium amorphum]
MKYVVLFMCLFSLVFGDELPHQDLDEGILWQKVNDDDDDKREVADETNDEEASDDDEASDDEASDDDETSDDDKASDDEEDEASEDDEASDNDEETSYDKNSPLKVTVSKAKGAVVVGQQLVYTVTVTNISDNEVRDVKLVLTTSFGIDPVEVLSSATSLVEDDDEVDEDGIVFEPLASLKSYQAIEYQVSCDLFNFYRGEDDNHPASAIVYYNVSDESTQRKTMARGEHFEVVAAPYLETDVESAEGFIDTGQELNYTIEISNIGPVDAENVAVLITYDAQQLQVEDIKAPCEVVLHSAGRIKLAEYPLLKSEDVNADEQESLVIHIKGKAMISGYASGLHVIAKVGKKPVQTISAKVKKEDVPSVKSLKLHKATFKGRKNNNRRWDIGWKKGVLPDSFVTISVAENGTWVKKFTSQVMKNNLRPIWEIDTQIQVSPKMKIQIEVYDKDLKKHDIIGSHTFTVDEKVFAQQELEFSFAGVEKISFSLED